MHGSVMLIHKILPDGGSSDVVHFFVDEIAVDAHHGLEDGRFIFLYLYQVSSCPSMLYFHV